MSTPFIADVVDGLSEWRIFGGKPNGLLLAESLKRQFGEPAATLKSAARPGLILNSTLVGHSGNVSPELARRFCEGKVEPAQCTEQGPDYTIHAGSRLVFTNMAVDQEVIKQHNQAAIGSTDTLFPYSGVPVAPDAFLKYAVINDGELSLPYAVSMSANFPPVFSDVRVDVKEKSDGKPGTDSGKPKISRYWVTDGGVADNRGIVSLLFAIKRGVQVLNENGRSIPDIHVVVAEASYANIDYARTRGIAAALGSSAPFASQLMLALLEDINQESGGRIHLHYLEMPMTLRSRGGLGTHWMLPDSVRVWNPYVEDVDFMHSKQGEFSTSISRPELLDVIAALHGDHLASCSQRISAELLEPSAKATEWICDGSHARTWCEFIEQMNGRTGEVCTADESGQGIVAARSVR